MQCTCDKHQGKEMFVKTFDLSVNYLWECLFGMTDFRIKYWESRKFGSVKVGDWKKVGNISERKLSYTVDLGGTLGKPANSETQVKLDWFLF